LRLFLRWVDPIASGGEQPRRSSTRARAQIIRGFDTFRHLRTIVPRAAAGQLLRIAAVDSLVPMGAIAPPRWPREPPVFSESELPTSRRRHSSNISMRQIRRALAVSSAICSWTLETGWRPRTHKTTRTYNDIRYFARPCDLPGPAPWCQRAYLRRVFTRSGRGDPVRRPRAEVHEQIGSAELCSTPGRRRLWPRLMTPTQLNRPGNRPGWPGGARRTASQQHATAPSSPRRTDPRAGGHGA
jgi:hypothetical protein